jgi:hypothetical protein
MKNPTIHRPFDRLHLLLVEIEKGNKDMHVDEKKISSFMDGRSLQEVAEEIFELETMPGQYSRYQEITLENDAGNWTIRKVLSRDGVSAHKALASGLLWSEKTGDADIESSRRFYEDMLKQRAMGRRYVDLLVDGGCEELSDIRAKLVYHRLAGDADNKEISW